MSEVGQPAIHKLKEVVADSSESDIVRHEAILAYSEISKDQDFVKEFYDDDSMILRESAIVANYMIEYWKK